MDCIQPYVEGCLGVALLTSAPITHGPQVIVQGTSATVWVRGSAGGAVRVKYWVAADSQAEPQVVLARLDTSADFTGRARLEGLRAGTRYIFVVETAAGTGARGGSFRTPAAADDRTPGAGTCSFVFGSCVGGQGYGRRAGAGPESGFKAFAAMKALQPDFFACNGDFIYADNAIDAVASTPWNKGDEHVVGEGMTLASDLAGFRARYRYHLADPKLAAFLAATPIVSTWDDHEIVDDWGAERLLAEGKGQLLEDGMRAWFDYQPYSSPVPAEPRRVYRRERWGPHLEMFVLDCRSYRARHESSAEGGTPQMKTILGAAQLAWLLEGLSASSATWKMICTSVPLSFPTGWPRPDETVRRPDGLGLPPIASDRLWLPLIAYGRLRDGEHAHCSLGASRAKMMRPAGPPRAPSALAVCWQGYDGWSDGNSQSSSGPERELLAILEHVRDAPISNVVWVSGDVHFPFCVAYDPFGSGSPLCYEIGATPIHALCLPPPAPGRQDTSLRPTVLLATIARSGLPRLFLRRSPFPDVLAWRYVLSSQVLYTGKVEFGGKLQNFGHCAVDDEGVATFSLRDADGKTLYELELPPTINTPAGAMAA